MSMHELGCEPNVKVLILGKVKVNAVGGLAHH